MKVAIVGGGLAGIAAAYTLLGDPDVTEVHLLEADGGYGGRASTDTTSIPGFAFDMGAQYIQDPTLNPLTQIAKDLGFETIEEEDEYMLRVERDGEWEDVATTDEEVAAVVKSIKTSYNLAKKKPNVVVAAKPRFDTQVEMFGHATSPYGPFTESAETWQYLAADRAREGPGDGSANLFVKRGIGTLVSAYGQLLPGLHRDRYKARFGTRVTSITHSDSGVTVAYANGSVAVDACIVTVPVSVLGSGAITFEPALPAAYKNALKALRLGSYKKLALQLRVAPADIEPGTNYYLIEAEPEGVWQYYRLPHNPLVLVAHAAGDFAAALDRMEDRDVYALFKANLKEAYDNSIYYSNGKAITNWSDDPSAGGAYSYTAFIGGGPDDPDALKARSDLGVPLGKLHFAGEATNLKCYGTLQAAYFEGVRAARAILA
ncbi:Monoamine oxidase [Polaromonas sp. YR568]|uniref:flavin monoamine oxidase family protein n=1 Tax=Polaromonas sp. YR568 TaxID=1855301 RepID=UPI0008E4A74B|nr:NAD(P)/FAD-dependent oxidoreductase [Polaromonas sp. YR568]SFU99719.1 Monoamine oxidase [Polaromonas sp. YR568]